MFNKTINSIFTIAVLTVIFTACSSSKQIVVHRAEDAHFRGMKTYSIIHDDSVGRPQLLEKLLRKEMDNLGFEYDSAGGDFTLGYAGKIDVRQGIQRISPGMMYGPGWGAGAPYYPSYSSYEYLEHVFVIDFIDFDRERILWQGSYSERIGNEPKPKDVSKAVSTIFRQFSAQQRR